MGISWGYMGKNEKPRYGGFCNWIHHRILMVLVCWCLTDASGSSRQDSDSHNLLWKVLQAV